MKEPAVLRVVCVIVRACLYDLHNHAYHRLCLLKACTPFDLQTPLSALAFASCMLHTITLSDLLQVFLQDTLNMALMFSSRVHTVRSAKS